MASVQFNWNVLPSTRSEEKKMVTPLGCLITPFHNSEGPLHTGEPPACSQCGGFFNSHVRFDKEKRTWYCQFCSNTNQFSKNFALSADLLPGSVVDSESSEANTVDYILNQDISANTRTAESPLIFTYVIDTYQHVDFLDTHDFDSLISGVIASIRQLPPKAQIFLISFSNDVRIHQPSIGNYVSVKSEDLFKKSDDVRRAFEDESFLESIIARSSEKTVGDKKNSRSLSSLGALSHCSESLISYIKDLRPNLTSSYKPARSTGLASFLALTLCNSHAPFHSMGKIMIFTSGPPTVGPGKIVSEKESMRTHKDIASLSAPHFVAAARFYKALGYMAAGYTPTNSYNSAYSASGKLVDSVVFENCAQFSVDIYSGSLDQVGLYEMKAMPGSCGGNMNISESFANRHFQDSLIHNIQVFLGSNINCKFTALPSPGLKVMKVLGNCTELQSSFQREQSVHLHHEKISDTTMPFDSPLKKQNATNQWQLGCVSSSDTVALFLETNVNSAGGRAQVPKELEQVYLQLQFRYWSMAKDAMILRVVTLKKQILSSIKSKSTSRSSSHQTTDANESIWMDGFCGNVWMSLLTRLLISKIDTSIGYDDLSDVSSLIDRHITKLLFYNDPKSRNLSSTENPFQEANQSTEAYSSLNDLKTLTYDLRRNPQLMTTFNTSPDETALNHHAFFRCKSLESRKMISPQFLKVERKQLVPIPFKKENLRDSSYFALDCITHVLIYRNCVLPHEKLPLHHSFNDPEILARKNSEFAEIFGIVSSKLLRERQIYPKIIVTQTGHSQARYLFSRLAENEDSSLGAPETKKHWWGSIKSLILKRKNPSDGCSLNGYIRTLRMEVQSFSIKDDI